MQKIIVIAGPTASGKSDLAISFATALDGVLINFDSVQFYKGLNLLSASPQQQDLQKCEHRLYQILDPAAEFTVADAKERIEFEIADVLKNNKIPILVGGTGLYLNALLHGIACIADIDESLKQESIQLLNEIGKEQFYQLLIKLDESCKRLNPGDSQRMLRAYMVYRATGKSIFEHYDEVHQPRFPQQQYIILKLMPQRQYLYKRINNRFEKMLKEGALDELRDLLQNHPVVSNSLLKASGVPELIEYLGGRMTYDDAVNLGKQKTRNYAKRQFTWFRNKLDGAAIEYGDLESMQQVAWSIVKAGLKHS